MARGFGMSKSIQRASERSRRWRVSGSKGHAASSRRCRASERRVILGGPVGGKRRVGGYDPPIGRLAQLGERCVRNAEVGGSIPPPSTKLKPIKSVAYRRGAGLTPTPFWLGCAIGVQRAIFGRAIQRRDHHEARPCLRIRQIRRHRAERGRRHEHLRGCRHRQRFDIVYWRHCPRPVQHVIWVWPEFGLTPSSRSRVTMTTDPDADDPFTEFDTPPSSVQ